MASTVNFPSTAEVQQLKALVTKVVSALRSQQNALKIRGMSLPPGTLQNVQQLLTQIEALEATLTENERELAQLRAVVATSAMMNSALDLDAVLSGAMDEVINLTGAERGFLLLLDEITGELEFRLVRSAEQDDVTTANGNQQVSRAILKQVFETRAPLLTDNAFKDPRVRSSETVTQFLLRSVLAVPLQYKDRIVGAVYVDNRFKSGVFTQRELTLLQAFANQVAVAIENARLFSGIQTTLADITEINELIENVFASIGSGVITTGADDRILTYNQAAAQILRRPAETALGHPLLDVLPPMSADVRTQLQTVREHNQSLTIEVQPEISGVPVVLSMKLSPLKDARQRIEGVTMVLDDLTAEREREQALNVVRRYLPPGMVENIHQISRLALGGERRDVTCLFADVCPITSFTPGLRAVELLELLNLYLSRATDAIYRADGLIDKYNGTEIMVLFNTPLNPQPEHARFAIEAALHLRQALSALYTELGKPTAAHDYRVGIHSGVATLGNVGSSKRRNYTAIGDTINLAKRLQEVAQPGQIIMSEDTLRHCEAVGVLPPGVRLVEREAILAKGRQQRTPIYEVFES